MTHLSILGFIVLLAFGCSKPLETLAVDDKVYTLTESEGNAIDALRSLADEAMELDALEKAPERAGYAPFVSLKRESYPKLNDKEWFEHCGEVVFRHLGYPIDQTEGASVSVGNTSNIFSVSHSAAAIRKFDELVIRWRIPEKEQYKRLMNRGQ